MPLPNVQYLVLAMLIVFLGKTQCKASIRHEACAVQCGWETLNCYKSAVILNMLHNDTESYNSPTRTIHCETSWNKCIADCRDGLSMHSPKTLTAILGTLGLELNPKPQDRGSMGYLYDFEIPWACDDNYCKCMEAAIVAEQHNLGGLIRQKATKPPIFWLLILVTPSIWPYLMVDPYPGSHYDAVNSMRSACKAAKLECDSGGWREGKT